MSFSADIKRNICKTQYECPACRLSFLTGFFDFGGRFSDEEVKYMTTVSEIADKVKSALVSELNIAPQKIGRDYCITGEDFKRLLTEINGDVFIYECCKISYIRGAFLGGGSVNAPEKKYHLEFSTRVRAEAEKLIVILEEFDFRPKMTKRKEKYVVYIKESGQISDLLGYITDGMAGLEFLSMQVEKEYNSFTQRRVNCDSANLNKLAMASARQVDAIKKIKAAGKWSSLADALQEIGELRLMHPDVSLETLGTMTEQQIGKSGVNHRLNRIVEYAKSLGKD